MKELVKKHKSKLRFAVVGGANTVIDVSVLFTLTHLGLVIVLANFLSTSLAFVFSFFANRSYTFQSTSGAKTQILPFLVVTLFGLWILQPVIIWATMIPLHAIDHTLALFIAKIIATAVTMIWNYILYEKVVFRT